MSSGLGGDLLTSGDVLLGSSNGASDRLCSLLQERLRVQFNQIAFPSVSGKAGEAVLVHGLAGYACAVMGERLPKHFTSEVWKYPKNTVWDIVVVHHRNGGFIVWRGQCQHTIEDTLELSTGYLSTPLATPTTADSGPTRRVFKKQ